MEIKTIARKWGSSIGVIIPKEVVDTKKIKENDEIIVRVDTIKPKAGVLFGFLRNWKKSTQEIKDEMRGGWLSASDREREEKWKMKK